jgi:N-acetylglucosaminyl-diphospho-decaprenol L-rhamnosyltransferase
MRRRPELFSDWSYITLPCATRTLQSGPEGVHVVTDVGNRLVSVPVSSMTVVVVSFCTREALRVCLRSVLSAGATEVVVADNGSTDGSAEMVARDFPLVSLLVDQSNPGYGAAANAAISRCRAEYVLLLNSDTWLRPGALEALRAYLDAHPEAALVGPRLLNLDGSLQRSCHHFPTPLMMLLDYSWVGRALDHIPVLRFFYLASFAHDRSRPVPWVSGAALAIRRSAFDAVGGFDPSYFMYYEEVDLAYRLHQAGWETHFTPVTDVTHLGGASTSQQAGPMFSQQVAAALQYFQRHHSQARVVHAVMAFRFAMRGKVVADSVRYRLARCDDRKRELAARLKNWRRVLAELRGL